jgi:predicted lactoylglutathione lyase
VIHHASLPVSDLTKSTLLYDNALSAIGYSRVYTTDRYSGYGIVANEDKLLLTSSETVQAVSTGFHLALSAPSQEAVDLFHKNALAFGALDNGKPGLREHYGPFYYAAFIIDLDGHHIEALS